jgi:hypothetical protein
MIERTVKCYLITMGVIYVFLGLWCAVLPQKSSTAVGFELQPGQGQSEFFTVYGGLEVGIGLLFLIPIFVKGDMRTVLLACVLLHAGLVGFRTISFILYAEFATTTYILATLEWLIFLTSTVLFCLYKTKQCAQ